MGLWAESNIPKMSVEELRHMSQVLDEVCNMGGRYPVVAQLLSAAH